MPRKPFTTERMAFALRSAVDHKRGQLQQPAGHPQVGPLQWVRISTNTCHVISREHALLLRQAATLIRAGIDY